MAENENINVKLMKPLLKDFPFADDVASAFSYISIDEQPIHAHVHMEIIHVIKGSIAVKVGVSHFTLNEGEFIIINPFELHALYATDKTNQTFILKINSEFYDPCKEGTIFVSEYDLYKKSSGDDFRKITATLGKLYTLHLAAALKTGESGAYKFPVCVGESDAEYERLLLRALINYFELHFTSVYFLLSDGQANSLKNNSLQANRLRSIMKYFYENFPKKIQLQDVADMTYVNRYHISHLIKSGVGYTFSELLQYIRIEKAEAYLLGTDLPINRIVEDLGFSSYKYFNQHFKEMFNMTPTEYRKKYQTTTINYKEKTYLHAFNEAEIREALSASSISDTCENSENIRVSDIKASDDTHSNIITLNPLLNCDMTDSCADIAGISVSLVIYNLPDGDETKSKEWTFDLHNLDRGGNLSVSKSIASIEQDSFTSWQDIPANRITTCDAEIICTGDTLYKVALAPFRAMKITFSA